MPGRKGVRMGKLHLRAGQSRLLKVKKPDGPLRGRGRKGDHVPPSGEKLLPQPGRLRLGVLRRLPEPRAVAGQIKLFPFTDGAAVRAGQRGIGVHGIRVQRIPCPALQKGKLLLLGQAGKARPGVLDQLRRGAQDGGLRFLPLQAVPPLGQVRAEIGVISVPK